MNTKYIRALALAALAGSTILVTGCAVIRGQETTGAYVDDAAITTSVKAKFVEDKTVDAGAINVQTLNGTVALSAGVGALLVVTRPWRLVSLTTLVVAVVKSSQLSGVVMSALADAQGWHEQQQGREPEL